MRVIDDHIDFDAYLAGPDESASVRPASNWLDDVIQSFEQPATATGAILPWAKTRETLIYSITLSDDGDGMRKC